MKRASSIVRTASVAVFRATTALLGLTTLHWAYGAASAPAPEPAKGRVREAALAGSWYPEGRAALAVETHRLLRGAADAPALNGKPVALVAPHAGWRFSGLAAAAAFRSLKPGAFARVVVVAPSHHGAFEGFAVDDAAAYRTPLAEIPVCTDAVAKLRDDRLVRTVPGVADQEHAVEIELPFLQETLGKFCLTPILAGRTTADEEKALALRLKDLNDGKTLYVFSSDFTHYGPRYDYAPFGPTAPPVKDKIRAQDDRAVALLSSQDAAGFRTFLAETGATICGRSGLGVLLELLPLIAPKAKATLLAHYASGDLPGTQDDSSVDYVALAYTREDAGGGAAISGPPHYAAADPAKAEVSEAVGRQLIRLARATLRTELLGADDLRSELAALPEGPEFEHLQAVFVTLNRTRPQDIAVAGRLRGCVGQVSPTFPLYEAVTEAAVNAALHDTRFISVHAIELGSLEVEVTVLSPPRPVASWREIKLGTHGIVLTKEGRRALFLPQVPGEQGWDIEQTLTALSQKAGLARDAWREGADFSVFTGQVFKEKP